MLSPSSKVQKVFESSESRKLNKKLYYLHAKFCGELSERIEEKIIQIELSTANEIDLSFYHRTYKHLSQ